MIEYDYVKTRRADVKPFKESQIPASRRVLRWVSKLQVSVYRKSGCRLMNKFIGGFPICVVTTTGAKSGEPRAIPLIHLPHGENKLLVASQGGMPGNPAWYYNVVANPEVKILVDGLERTYQVRRVSDEEKAALWPHLLSLYPDFDQYQARTHRNIPVFSCVPVGD